MIVMNSSIRFLDSSLMKLHQRVATYEEIRYLKEEYFFKYEMPQFNSKRYYRFSIEGKAALIFDAFQEFYLTKLEYPIFITVGFSSIEGIDSGYYVVDLEQKNYQMISEGIQMLPEDNVKRCYVEINYFISANEIKKSKQYTDYMKSCIEIGRLDEYIGSILSRNSEVTIKRKFMPTNAWTKRQGLDITQNLLTQTTIFDWGE